MLFINTNTNEIKNFKVVNNKVLTTIKINNLTITNPTLNNFLSIGWEEYTPPTPEPYKPTYDELYKQRIVELVRGKYDIDDELAILRQRESKPEQFNEYNDYVEQCKVEARAEYSLLTEGA